MPGAGGGFRQSGDFLNTGAFMNVLFGGWEVNSAAMAMPRAMRQGMGQSPLRQLQLQEAAVNRITSGPVGSFIGTGFELSGMLAETSAGKQLAQNPLGFGVVGPGILWNSYESSRRKAIEGTQAAAIRGTMGDRLVGARNDLAIRAAGPGMGRIAARFEAGMDDLRAEFSESFPGISNESKNRMLGSRANVLMGEAMQDTMDLAAGKIRGGMGAVSRFLSNANDMLSGGGIHRGIIPMLHGFADSQIADRQARAFGMRSANPLGAAMLGVDMDAMRAIRNNPLATGDILRVAQAHKDYLTQEDAHERSMRKHGLSADIGVAELEASGRPFSARARGMAESAMGRAKDMRFRGRGDEADMALRFGQLGLEGLRRQLIELQIGTSTAFSPFRTDLSGTSTQRKENEDQLKALQEIATLLGQIKAKIGIN